LAATFFSCHFVANDEVVFSENSERFVKLVNPSTHCRLSPSERGCFDMVLALIEYQAGSFAFELGREGATLLGHQIPLYGEHSRLNGCPE
jgi:hypothetical protein